MMAISFMKLIKRESKVPAELFVRLFQETCLELRSPTMIVLKGVSRRFLMSAI